MGCPRVVTTGSLTRPGFEIPPTRRSRRVLDRKHVVLNQRAEASRDTPASARARLGMSRRGGDGWGAPIDDRSSARRPPIPYEQIRGEARAGRGSPSTGWDDTAAGRAPPRVGDQDPYDSAPNSARSSAYTDADDDSSLAASDFESGAEDLESDDEAAGGTGARTLAEDLAAVRIGGGGRGGDARGDGRGAAATSSTGIDREAQAARGAAVFEDDEIQEAFAAFDEDGDGLLDVNDVQSFFDALGESLTLYEVAELIKMVDGDGDGMVNFDEFFDLATRSARFFEQGG